MEEPPGLKVAGKSGEPSKPVAAAQGAGGGEGVDPPAPTPRQSHRPPLEEPGPCRQGLRAPSTPHPASTSASQLLAASVSGGGGGLRHYFKNFKDSLVLGNGILGMLALGGQGGLKQRAGGRGRIIAI